VREKRADELRPTLLHVVSPWEIDETGALTRTSTAIEEEEIVNAPSSLPVAADVPPRRKQKSKPNGKTAEPIRAAPKKGLVITVRVPPEQLEAIDTWRGRYVGLDLPAATRALLDLGMTMRPQSVVDPLGLANATHGRILRAKKGKL
jgi:hypothetical protein